MVVREIVSPFNAAANVMGLGANTGFYRGGPWRYHKTSKRFFPIGEGFFQGRDCHGGRRM